MVADKLIEAYLFPISNLDYSSPAGRRKLRSIMALGKIAPYYKLYLSADSANKKIISHYTINTEESRPPFKKGAIVKTNYRVIERISNTGGNLLFIYATQASHRKL